MNLLFCTPSSSYYSESTVIQIGNLIDYMAIRYEAKHKFTKTAAITVNNSNNLRIRTYS